MSNTNARKKQKILKKSRMLCPCCMEEHEVLSVEVMDENIFKEVYVEYPAEHFYCDRADEYYTSEKMLQTNDISMKNAYRRKQGLLTSDEISAVREKYGISQSDLCCLLGWGGKTITRYEGHQIQDVAHDTILRKVADDPEWFLSLLEKGKGTISSISYKKYYKAAVLLFEEQQDVYLRKSILAKYARYHDHPMYTGNMRISLNVVTDVIRYFANAAGMINLYKVKLMKLLWYSDALSYKRRGHAITGLVYQALPMGAVPIAHDSIMDLREVEYEEIEMGDGTGYHFKETDHKEYPFLSPEDMDILDEIIRIFGKSSKDAIVESMHKEQAYRETAPRTIISFSYANMLSIE